MKVVLLWLVAAMAQAAELPVWTDGNTTANNLGGKYGSYGSSDDCRIDINTDRSPGLLEIHYANHGAAPCGVYMHLFDDRVAPGERHFVDLAQYPFLNLRLQGSLNAEVRLADGELFGKEDSNLVQTLGDFAGRDVSLPTGRAKLRHPEAAQLVLAFPKGVEGTLLISRIVFSSSETMEKVEETRQLPSTPRALWFWEFGDCLNDPEVCGKVFRFAQASHINTIYAQIAYQCGSGAGDSPTSENCHLLRPDRLREILRIANSQGLHIHALDGAAEYSLTSYHPRMMSLVHSVMEFNGSSPADERFSGIHFDIEPYLLLGFSGGARERILRQYLSLNRKVVDFMNSLGPARIEYGADIPFWYDEGGENPSNPYVISFEGKTQDVSRHLIDMLDNVVLMDYRNTALGPDGIANLGKGEVAYGSSHGKKVWIGVETIPQRASTVVFLAGLSERRWNQLRDLPIMLRRNLRGYGLRTLRSGNTRYVGLAPRDGVLDAAFLSALEELAQRLGLTPVARSARDAALKTARADMGRGYRDFTPVTLAGRSAFSVTSVPVEKISFAGSTRSAMDRTLFAVENQFASEPGFGGIAIHSFASYSEMPE